MNATQTPTQTAAERYGVHETNPLAYEHSEVDYSRNLSLRDVAQAGGKIVRVRVLTEVRPGFGRIADISYIHAEIDGKLYALAATWPATGLLKNVKGDFIAWAKEQGVYAKGLGLLDENNWSILY